MKIQKLFLGAIFALGMFNANAADDGCNRSTTEPTDTSIIKYTFDTIVDVDYLYDLWWLNCDDSVQIFVKAYTKKGVISTTTGQSDDYIRLYQNKNIISGFTLFQRGLEITNNKPLYRLLRWGKNEGLKFDLPTEVCISLADKFGDYVCNNVFPQNRNGGAVTTGNFSVTGTWYDPAYDGSGFNIVEATNGLFMYFYGYKAEGNGQAQWLLSAVGPKSVTKGQSIELTVYEPTEGNSANFLTKPASGSGVSEWGKVSLTFNSCSSGTIVLDGKDGKVTHNVVKLANIKNLTCTE